MQKHSWIVRLVTRITVRMRTMHYLAMLRPVPCFQLPIVLELPLIRLAQLPAGILCFAMVARLVAAANHQYLCKLFG